MADQLLSVVNTLLGHLTSQSLAAYARIHGLSDQLTKWHKNLVVIDYVMVSAEERQMLGDTRVNLWLDDLREVAYDMEDLLDLFSIEAQGKVLKVETRRRSNKLTSFLFPCCSKMDPRALLSDHRLAKQIEEVDLRLEEVINLKALLGLAENYMAQPPANPYRPCPPSFSRPVHRFVGREEQMERLLARLTRSDLAYIPNQPFIVVSIVGMGGLGKTALAKQLYNHEAVGSEAFPVKAWISVSDAFDIVTVTRNILFSLDPHIYLKGKPLEALQKMLADQLVGKKFFVVLDDVWIEIHNELWSLLVPFRSGANGSRILLTTRSRRVAGFAGDHTPLALDLLSTDESLSLLAYCAIGEESFENRPHLQDIAVRLAKKCGGLPLAVTIIGGLLSIESDEKKWKKVLEHNLWKIQDKNNRIPVVLRLSYIHLPIYLKQCFAACAIFPKGYLFGRDQLIDLWSGHGLLKKRIGERCYDTGIDYLHELEARSLLQKAKDDGSLYSMHGLVNDLARSVVGSKYYYTDEYEGPSSKEYQEKIRRAAFFTRNRKYLDAIEVDAYCSMKKLRAFISFNRCSNNYNDVFVSDKVMNDLIMGWECLRMLSLRGFHVKKLPDHIGDLKLLRFIDLSFTEVEVLPESICGLINLESLILQSCIRLKALPRSIHKLSKLIHLDITCSNLIEEMPPHIGSLTNLEILPRFVVGKEIGHGLKELGPLKDLVGKLHIANLKEVKDIGDAEDANLHEKEGIRDLSYDWGAGDDEGTLPEEQDEVNILDHLQPSRKIELLEILNYGGRTFPSWFGHPYLDNVTAITLRNCRSVESLPSLGKLPSLKRLEISHLDALSRIGDEFFGTEKPFPSLLRLTFWDMPAWEEWSSREDYPENKKLFPRLQELNMRDCPLLKRGLPRRLDGLSGLDIAGCPLLETWGDSLSLPSLKWMRIHDSGLLNYLVDVTSLTQLTIERVPQLVGLDRKFLSSCVSLKDILIWECPRFKSFVDGDFGKVVPPKLETIDISCCGALEKLPDDFDCLPSLTHLAVDDCWKLSSLPSSGFPSTLRRMSLRGCPSRPLSQLLSMRLPRRASFLRLGGCEEFTLALPECWLPTELEQLVLFNLKGLNSITDIVAGDNCSRSLRGLFIQQCQSLTTLPDCLQHLSSLSDLRVFCCPALELDFFPYLPYSLSEFKLIDCPKVRALPRDMGKLTSLKCLTVYKCHAITGFPRGGLPPNLESLILQHCENLNQPLEEWGLKELRALRELTIEGRMRCMDEVVCFPSSVSGSGVWSRVLPSSLVMLEISEMKELERLAGGLRDHLTSLRKLVIACCEKMRFMPEEGLPDSLEEFRIRSCPLLEERCSEERKGEYWPLLQLVPRVKILST